LGWWTLSVCPRFGKGFWITFVLPDLDRNVDFRMRDLCKIWSWIAARNDFLGQKKKIIQGGFEL